MSTGELELAPKRRRRFTPSTEQRAEKGPRATPDAAWAVYRPRDAAPEPGTEHVKPRTILQQSAHRNRYAHALRLCARVGGLLAADLLSLTFAIELIVRSSLGAFPQWMHLESWQHIEFPQTITAICAGLFLSGTYRGGDARRDASRLASGTGLGLLIAFWQPLWGDFVMHVGSALFGAVVLIPVVVAVRLVTNRFARTIRPEFKSARTLLVGNEEEVALVRKTMPLDGANAFVLKAQLDPSAMRAGGEALQSRHGLDDLPRMIKNNDIDTIVLCGQLADRTLSHIMVYAEAAGCRVLSPSRAFMLANLIPSVHWQDGTPMVQLTRPGLHGRDLVVKRLLDLTLTGAILLLAAPVMLLVALLVRVTSRGPIIFAQRRVGYAAKTFTIFKFRTMYVDAEERLAALQASSVYGNGKLFKMEADPRITPVGRWLRKLSLDELPQLFNVVRSEMSLVGPRPPLPREVDLYEDDEYIRFGMKPGITGPWQVSGRNRITSFDDVLRIESAYFAGWTIWRDFRILAKTIPAVLKMDGAQ
jgi:exopolysaccharide biosynthesis polyprenyl glycosylphosphotransferase